MTIPVEHARPVAEAAAPLREELRRRAAVLAGVEAGQLSDAPAGFSGPNGPGFSYGELVGDADLVLASDALPAAQVYTFDPEREHRQVGEAGQPVQAHEIVTGQPVFAGDIHRPAMIYGRAVQAPSPNAKLVGVDFGDAAEIDGVLHLIDDRARSLVGIVAETPTALDQAMGEVGVTWDKPGVFSAKDIADLVDVDAALERGDLEGVVAQTGHYV